MLPLVCWQSWSARLVHRAVARTAPLRHSVLHGTTRRNPRPARTKLTRGKQRFAGRIAVSAAANTPAKNGPAIAGRTVGSVTIDAENKVGPGADVRRPSEDSPVNGNERDSAMCQAGQQTGRPAEATTGGKRRTNIASATAWGRKRSCCQQPRLAARTRRMRAERIRSQDGASTHRLGPARPPRTASSDGLLGRPKAKN